MSPKANPKFAIPPMQDAYRYSVALVQNQWYDMFTGGAVDAGAGSIVKNAIVQFLGFEQLVLGETFEIRIIADNEDETLIQVLAVGTEYQIVTSVDTDNADHFDIDTAGSANYHRLKFMARHLQIMYRKTTANGANATTVKCLINHE